MGLQRFEAGLERMVEGVFSRSSRSSIRPVELGRRLLREMDDHRSVDVKGRRIVPNHFTFHLSARDHAGFAEIEHALITELTEAAREYARDEGYHLLGPISVALLVDNNLKPGRFGVASVLREASAQTNLPVFPPVADAVVVPRPEPVFDIPEAALSDLASDADGSAALAAGAAAAAAAGAVRSASVNDTGFVPIRGELVLPSGKRCAIGEEVVTIGRLPECTLTLDDPNVSRRHAEVRAEGTVVKVIDLGSTNGVKLNGQRITGEHALSDGDIISLGATHLRYEAA